jgi:hypothetical protein
MLQIVNGHVGCASARPAVECASLELQIGAWRLQIVDCLALAQSAIKWKGPRRAPYDLDDRADQLLR